MNHDETFQFVVNALQIVVEILVVLVSPALDFQQLDDLALQRCAFVLERVGVVFVERDAEELVNLRGRDAELRVEAVARGGGDVVGVGAAEERHGRELQDVELLRVFFLYEFLFRVCRAELVAAFDDERVLAVLAADGVHEGFDDVLLLFIKQFFELVLVDVPFVAADVVDVDAELPVEAVVAELLLEALDLLLELAVLVDEVVAFGLDEVGALVEALCVLGDLDFLFLGEHREGRFSDVERVGQELELVLQTRTFAFEVVDFLLQYPYFGLVVLDFDAVAHFDLGEVDSEVFGDVGDLSEDAVFAEDFFHFVAEFVPVFDEFLVLDVFFVDQFISVVDSFEPVFCFGFF